jgi:AcrR family transcriptional regulator
MPQSSQSRAGTRAARKSQRRVGGGSQATEGIKDLVSQLKRDRIISAAIDLFYTQGYAQTTLDQVARSLGVTKPFIYQYFGSKKDVLAEICSRSIKDAHDTINRALSQRGTPSEKMKVIVRDFTLHVLNNQANAIIYSREETELAPKDREMINQLRREFDRRLVALLREGLEEGEFAIEDIRLTSLVIASVVGWSPVWFRSGGRLTKEEAAEGIASLILMMVGFKGQGMPAGAALPPMPKVMGG